MDQGDEAGSGEQGEYLDAVALAVLEVAIEAANRYFPCDDGGLPTQDGPAG